MLNALMPILVIVVPLSITASVLYSLSALVEGDVEPHDGASCSDSGCESKLARARARLQSASCCRRSAMWVKLRVNSSSSRCLGVGANASASALMPS